MTRIRIYNIKKKTKLIFKPIDTKKVRMYVCGPTVYNFAHIGNARTAIVFDIMFRLLRYVYGNKYVIYVRNITDVDDKINARALAEGKTIKQIVKNTISQYHKDINALGVLPPTIEPFATKHITEMIEMIEILISKKYAYIINKHVLFSISSMNNYGNFSSDKFQSILTRSRINITSYKRNKMDFVLWKPSSTGTPSWDSPWGIGRPGWHIECSAMSKKYLGKTFDIHGGGLDLIFPHHQNEIAQSCCANNTDYMANYWMHNEFLNIKDKKMSKSLNNFLTINDACKQYPAEALRLMILMTHYRKIINYNKKLINEAIKILNKWYSKIDNIGNVNYSDIPKKFIDALSDDLNTPKAISILHKLDSKNLKSSAQFIGLLLGNKNDFINFKPINIKINEDKILKLINDRHKAKLNKDWILTDKIRKYLLDKSIIIKDFSGGTSWEYKK